MKDHSLTTAGPIIPHHRFATTPCPCPANGIASGIIVCMPLEL
jgi:hypothetical protein